MLAKTGALLLETPEIKNVTERQQKYHVELDILQSDFYRFNYRNLRAN